MATNYNALAVTSSISAEVNYFCSPRGCMIRAAQNIQQVVRLTD